MSKVNEIKQNIANLVIETFEAQESESFNREQNERLKKRRQALYNFEENQDLYEGEDRKKFFEYIQELEKLNTGLIAKIEENSIPEHELKKIIQRNVGDYMNLVEKATNEKAEFFDVVFKLDSQYEGGTETFRTIIEHLNKKGANIQIIKDQHIGQNTPEHFGGIHNQFIAVMPSSSYTDFNKLINADQKDSRNDIMGAREGYFFFNRLDKNVTLDMMKEYVEEDSDIRNVFRTNVGVVAVNLASNGVDEDLIKRSITDFFENIRYLENDPTATRSVGHNINGSMLQYQEIENFPEYSGQRVTPYIQSVILTNPDGLNTEQKEVNKKKVSPNKP